MVDFVYVYCANLTPSFFYDEGYLFCKLNIDKFDKEGDNPTMLGDKPKKLGNNPHNVVRKLTV
ncbi:hypothetical protein B1B04_00425 [Lysinibacillus sp. KCTC 33748]|nr:hypothetical protein B1B04_00425 [Lysinibacillus sp. KCTC 33748]SKB27434.1 hypothetical protein SAMN06295926_10187 [Lysinibacillus sp. AC-3]